MFSRIFSFSNATLLVALALSTIAAWYSIIGLTAIFAGAVVPIIIMGSVLELAKITTTVWLRKYWKRCTWIMKVYLVPAVVALAVLTSMGIFGFLSKAHMDQGLVGGDSIAKVQIFDEKIKTSKENIEANRKALKQMDEAVDQVMARSDSEKGADRAVTIRKGQAKERIRLQNEITAEQTKIAKLNEERAPIAAEVRKVEAEVGPIKYIAAFIYGDNPDANLLERAVRWVIILLVVVFDPLAIMLVIAANQSKDWDDEKEDDKHAMAIIPPKEEDTRPFTEEEITALDEPVEEIDIVPAPETEPKAIWAFPTDPEPESSDHYVANKFSEFDPRYLVTKVITEEESMNIVASPAYPDYQILEDVIEEDLPPITSWVEIPDPEETVAEEEIKVDDSPPYEGIRDLKTGEWIQTGPALADPAVKSTMGFKDLGGGYVEFEGKRMALHVLKDKRPDLFAIKEDNPREVKITFGPKAVTVGLIGDTFIRTDAIPHRVFKSNGEKWIEINKNTTASYLSNTNYLQHLMEKIATGEYEPDLLTELEQEAISNHLKSA
jgi:hypothetical protein